MERNEFADNLERQAEAWWVIGRPIEAAQLMRRAVQLRKLWRRYT